MQVNEELCGAPHPKYPDTVHCSLSTENNARTEVVYKMTPMQTPDVDEGGNLIVLEAPRDVHVHRGIDNKGDVFRWEG